MSTAGSPIPRAGLRKPSRRPSPASPWNNRPSDRCAFPTNSKSAVSTFRRQAFARSGCARTSNRSRKWLTAPEHHVAETGAVLTESQVQALEKKQDDDVTHGEIETAHPGISAAKTFYVGTLKGGRIYQQTVVGPIRSGWPATGCSRRVRRSPGCLSRSKLGCGSIFSSMACCRRFSSASRNVMEKIYRASSARCDELFGLNQGSIST